MGLWLLEYKKGDIPVVKKWPIEKGSIFTRVKNVLKKYVTKFCNKVLIGSFFGFA